MRAKIYATGWEMLATEHETEALLENIVGSIVAYRAAGVIEIVIDTGFRIQVGDVAIQRYGPGNPGRGIWAPTPAMAPGATSRLWSVADLVEGC